MMMTMMMTTTTKRPVRTRGNTKRITASAARSDLAETPWVTRWPRACNVPGPSNARQTANPFSVPKRVRLVPSAAPQAPIRAKGCSRKDPSSPKKSAPASNTGPPIQRFRPLDISRRMPILQYRHFFSDGPPVAWGWPQGGATWPQERSIWTPTSLPTPEPSKPAKPQYDPGCLRDSRLPNGVAVCSGLSTSGNPDDWVGACHD